MTKFNTIDDFLSHSAQSKGSGYLGTEWQKKGFIDIVMQTSQLPFSVWRHGFPRVDIRQEKGSEEAEKRVFGGNWVCHEPESVLKAQYFREDNGTRKQPPHYCPLCKLIECVHGLIAQEKLVWTKPIFRFDADDPKKTQVLHAGGICSMYRDEKLDEAQKKELKKAGIFLKEAWKESVYAKMSYVFSVVDLSDVAAGGQIAVVSSGLGDKVKKIMAHAMNPKALGPDKGNPFKNPYAIQWVFKDGEKFDERYDACALTIPLSPRVLKIVHGEPPDTSQITKPFNIKTMRAYLEKHALVELPWDEIFDVRKPADEEASVVEEDPDMEFPPKELGRSVSTKADEVTTTIPCDECKHPMAPTDAVCAKCGTKYEVDADDEAAPAPAKVVAPPAAKKQSGSAKPKPEADDDDDEGDPLNF
jgi:hypothetical protein